MGRATGTIGWSVIIRSCEPLTVVCLVGGPVGTDTNSPPPPSHSAASRHCHHYLRSATSARALDINQMQITKQPQPSFSSTAEKGVLQVQALKNSSEVKVCPGDRTWGDINRSCVDYQLTGRSIPPAVSRIPNRRRRQSLADTHANKTNQRNMQR